MDTRMHAYPHIWYGIWTGPDSYNAHYAQRPGEAFFHLPTPMCDFPALNMNLHACFLHSLIRVLGFNAIFEGYLINLNFFQPIQFSSAIYCLENTSQHIDFQIKIKTFLEPFKIVLQGRLILQIDKITSDLIEFDILERNEIKIILNVKNISEAGVSFHITKKIR
jgi:hypothetical protein